MNENRRKGSGEGAEGATTSRDFEFPRERVFKMLTDPQTASKFFSPEGAHKVLFEWDARPGGSIRIHDRHSDGTKGKTSGTITEFVVPELLVYRSKTTLNDAPAPFEALQTVKFEELGPTRTRVTVTVRVLDLGAFPGSVEDLKEGFMGGWGDTFNMLERELR